MRLDHRHLLAALALVALGGCAKKKKTEDPPPAITVEPSSKEDDGTDEAEADGTEEAPAKEPSWGEKGAELAKKLSVAAVVCNDKYLKALKPDELLVGKPALVTSDGVVTVMDDACNPLSEGYADAKALLENKHPEADTLLRHWSIVADQYARVSRTAVNIGASAKRRELNAKELKEMLPTMTAETVPALIKAAVPVMKWNADTKAGYEKHKTPKASADALAYWKPKLEKSRDGILGLAEEWKTHGHDLLKAKLFPRKRYLAWLESYWKARLDRERKGIDRIVLDDEKFGGDLRAAGKDFDALAETWFKEGWAVAMDAFADKSVIDEEKLKAGRKALAKANKELEKGFSKLDFPKP